MAKKIAGLIFLLLPVFLWPLSFILLRSEFIYAMLASTFILAALSLALHRRIVPWKRLSNNISLVSVGLVGALILCIVFLLGSMAVALLGLSASLSDVYAMIYSISNKAVLLVLLALIAVFEEIYWRGALQAYFERRAGSFSKVPWALTAAYYALVHLSTFNVVLVGSAAVVGVATGIIAYRYGILSSIVTHIVWIELVVVFLPFAFV